MKNITLNITLTAMTFFAGTIFSNVSLAACTTPSCADLGYIKNTADCLSNKLVCPFDATKAFCDTAEEDTPIEDITETCKVGSILYSDKKCSSVKRPGKTPIAIVFDAANRRAVALEARVLPWTDGTAEYSPTNLPSVSYDNELKDMDGKGNTAKIIAYRKSSGKRFYAAEFANSYSTEGTKPGDWYLFSMGEGYIYCENVEAVDDARARLGLQKMSGWYYWTSTSRGEFIPVTRWKSSGCRYAERSKYNNNVVPTIQY